MEKLGYGAFYLVQHGLSSGIAEVSIWYSTTNSLFACLRDDDENCLSNRSFIS